MKNIYCVIVTYNGIQWMERCLSSLVQSTHPIIPVIIDNGSTDGTKEYIETHYPQIPLMAQKTNLGFGQANNVGIRYSLSNGADYVLLLNQDAWIEKDMIDCLLSFADDNSLISPLHMNGNGDKIDRNFCHNALMRSPEMEQFLHDTAKGKTGRYYTDEINAACWLLPRAVLESIGGFNPLFFHYSEDSDYLQRLHYHQKGIFFVPSARVYHDREGVPTKKPSKQSIYQNLILRAIDIRYSRLSCLLHRWRYALGVIHTACADHRPADMLYYFQALCRYHTMHLDIIANRKIIKEKGAHWID